MSARGGVERHAASRARPIVQPADAGRARRRESEYLLAPGCTDTTLGVIQNSVDGTTTGTPIYSSTAAAGEFDGIAALATDVLVKYTYFGDANLDGKVDGSDYAQIDAG